MSSPFEFFEKYNPHIQERYIINKYKTRVNIAMEKLEDEFKMYAEYPSTHPCYINEWAEFWSRRYQELSKQGIHPSEYDFKTEWEVYWKLHLNKLHLDEKLAKKTEIRKELNLSEEFVARIEFDFDNVPFSTIINSGKSKKRSKKRAKKRRLNSAVPKPKPLENVVVVCQNIEAMTLNPEIEEVPLVNNQAVAPRKVELVKMFSDIEIKEAFSLNDRAVQSCPTAPKRRCRPFELTPSRLSLSPVSTNTPSDTTSPQPIEQPIFSLSPLKPLVPKDTELKDNEGKEVEIIHDKVVDTLTDEDLKFLLENFSELTAAEQSNLTEYILLMDSNDPERTKKLIQSEEEAAVESVLPEADTLNVDAPNIKIEPNGYEMPVNIKPISVILNNDPNPPVKQEKYVRRVRYQEAQPQASENLMNQLCNQPMMLYNPMSEWSQPTVNRMVYNPFSANTAPRMNLNVKVEPPKKNLKRSNIIQLTK